MKKRHRRKNFFPTFLLATLSWLGWTGVVLFMAPSSFWVISLFFLSLFLAVFLTTALILANSRRGLLVALALVGSLFLHYHQLANVLNLILFLAILLCLEIAFFRRD